MPYLPTVPSKQQHISTRFAPSPNGLLHPGHAWAAICAHDFARRHDGAFLLRIEDIDGTRSRAEFVEAILADLHWLGLCWDVEPQFQSSRTQFYRAALAKLHEKGLLYKCTCSRSDIAQALRTKSVRHGPDGPHYPGTCKSRDTGAAQGSYSWRLDMAAAVTRCGDLFWHDLVAGRQRAEPEQFGDIILWRKDAPASYHLAVTLDDAESGFSHVVRGQDLFAYTHIHRLLQALLELPVPQYWHHALLLGPGGEKLAKSKQSASLLALRRSGVDGFAFAQSLRRGELPLGISMTGE